MGALSLYCFILGLACTVIEALKQVSANTTECSILRVV